MAGKPVKMHLLRLIERQKNLTTVFLSILSSMSEQKQTIVLSGLVKELKEAEAGFWR